MLLLAILSRTADRTQTLRAIAQRIETLPERGEQSNVAAATSVLAGLVLEKAVIRKILREDLMRDSVIYQDILEQGLQKGVQQGIQQGIQQDVQQGIQRERALLLKLLNRRVGDLTPELTAQVQALSVDQLEQLGEALLDFTQPEELLTWLANNQKA